MDDTCPAVRYFRGGFLRNILAKGDRLMQPIRFVRITVSFVGLGLAGLVLGCSGEFGSGSNSPPDKEASKTIAEQMKNDQLQRKAALSGKRP